MRISRRIPGAAAFYNGTQQSFLDKWGNAIFLTPMILGGIASVLAAAWKFLRDGEPRKEEQALDSLYALGRRIRTQRGSRTCLKSSARSTRSFRCSARKPGPGTKTRLMLLPLTWLRTAFKASSTIAGRCWPRIQTARSRRKPAKQPRSAGAISTGAGPLISIKTATRLPLLDFSNVRGQRPGEEAGHLINAPRP